MLRGGQRRWALQVEHLRFNAAPPGGWGDDDGDGREQREWLAERGLGRTPAAQWGEWFEYFGDREYKSREPGESSVPWVDPSRFAVPADGHAWGADLVCMRAGCGRDWELHRVWRQKCVGGAVITRCACGRAYSNGWYNYNSNGERVCRTCAAK